MLLRCRRGPLFTPNSSLIRPLAAPGAPAGGGGGGKASKATGRGWWVVQGLLDFDESATHRGCAKQFTKYSPKGHLHQQHLVHSQAFPGATCQSLPTHHKCPTHFTRPPQPQSPQMQRSIPLPFTCQDVPTHHQVDGHHSKAEAKQCSLQQRLATRTQHTTNKGGVAALTSLG